MKFGEIAAEIIIDTRKLTEYVLNSYHPRGKDKAFMFEKHLGFTIDNYQLLLDQISNLVLDAEGILKFTDEHGQHYEVDLEIMGIKEGQQEIVGRDGL